MGQNYPENLYKLEKKVQQQVYENNQLVDIALVSHQIPKTKNKRNISQTVRKLNTVLNDLLT